MLLGVVVAFFTAITGLGGPRGVDPGRVVALGIGMIYLVFGLLGISIGYGLRSFKNWARWTVVVLCSLSVLYMIGVSVFVAFVSFAIPNALPRMFVGLAVTAATSFIPIYFIYLMVSSKATVIFSSEYKYIVAATPHIKPKTGFVVKLLIVLILGGIILAILAALFGNQQ